jgi:predicted nucleic acid-binding protein
MPERLVIVNTSPLLYLHLAGCLEILARLYRGVIIPPAVEAELAAGRQAGVETPALNSYPWISIIPVQSVALVSSILDLGPGESEVIALGLEHPGSLLIIDDRLARRIAALSRLACTGTLGVLVKAKQAGCIPAVAPVIQRMQSSGIWLGADLVAMVLAQAGELPLP